MSEPTFCEWAIVELTKGRTQIAGFCTEQQVAGSVMLRVDVPSVNGNEPFTKFYSSTVIYSITPTTECVVKDAAGKLSTIPIPIWLVPYQQQTTMPPIDKDDPDYDF